jgi:peroxiredoxin
MQKHQGVSRRFTVEGLVVLALAVLLIQELGLTTPRAIAVAEDLARNQGRFAASRGLNLVLDISSFRAELLERLESAVEIAPVPRRGRPPKTKTGRLA